MRSLVVLTPRTPPPSPAAMKELETENPALFHLWLRSGEPLGPYLAKRDRSLSTPLLSQAHRTTRALPPAPQDWPPSGQAGQPCSTVAGPGVVSRLQPDGSQHSPMPHWQGLATPIAGTPSQRRLQHGGSQPSPGHARELAQPRQGHHTTPLPQPRPQPPPQPPPPQRLPQPWQPPPLSQLSRLSPAPAPPQWQLTPPSQCQPFSEGGSGLRLGVWAAARAAS